MSDQPSQSADFLSTLAAFRARHPEIEVAEIFAVDLNALVRGKRVPLAKLDGLAKGAMKMPTSTLGLDLFSQDVAENAIAIELGDPDGPMVPVAETLRPMLWADPLVAQLQCTIAEGDGSPSPYDPRGVLAKVAEAATARGLSPVLALELEFYLVDPSVPEPPRDPISGERLAKAQIYNMDILRAFEPILADINTAAEALGAPAETAICEYGPGQFEINLRHEADPLAAADHMIALKRAVRGVARRHGLDASFMPKPYGEHSGSGMHMHLSLWDAAGRNIFSAENGDGPNPALRHAVAGVLRAMPDCMLIFAPNLNSYRRFMPGSYAPMVAAWGHDNRGAAVRLPETTGPGARLEHRTSGSDANPYLLAASVLAAALDGIDASQEPPGPVDTEASAGDGTPLPLDWMDAEQVFASSAFVERWLGAEMQRVFAGIKRQERTTLLARVTDVEYDTYLRLV